MGDKQAFSSFGGSTCLCDRQSYPPIFGRSHQTNHPTLVYVSDRPAMSSWGDRNYLQVYREFPRTQERSHISKMLYFT
nr:hypothetical protein [Fischerella thermalis]